MWRTWEQMVHGVQEVRTHWPGQATWHVWVVSPLSVASHSPSWTTTSSTTFMHLRSMGKIEAGQNDNGSHQRHWPFPARLFQCRATPDVGQLLNGKVTPSKDRWRQPTAALRPADLTVQLTATFLPCSLSDEFDLVSFITTLGNLFIGNFQDQRRLQSQPSQDTQQSFIVWVGTWIDCSVSRSHSSYWESILLFFKAGSLVGANLNCISNLSLGIVAIQTRVPISNTRFPGSVLHLRSFFCLINRIFPFSIFGFAAWNLVKLVFFTRTSITDLWH